MNNLSNANLLDETVGENLKNERLKKTAQTAQNPNMERKSEIVNQMQMQPQQQQPLQMQQPSPQVQNIERQTPNNDDEQIPNNLPVRDYGKKQVDNDSDEKKILGMKPALFYTLLGVAVIAGGYFAYNKFIKGKKSGKSLDTGSATPTANIGELPIT